MSASSPNDSSRQAAVIERAIGVFKSLTLADPRHAAELGRARYEFFGAAGNRVSSLDAERRLMEWFLFERSYDEFGSIGARVLAEDWLEQVDPSLTELLPSLIDSRVGTFEVTSVAPGSGVWIRDLSGVGEYPLTEPEASNELKVGDLIVGRLYPIGDGVFLASAAAACVRNPELTEALRRDLTRARSERRGVPRLSQQTLEALFFQSSLIPDRVPAKAAAAGPAPAPSLETVLADCREWFLAQGISDGDLEEIFEALAEEPFDPADLAPGGSDILGGILAELAFETDIDLAKARALLLAAWTLLGAPQPGPGVRPEADSAHEHEDQEYSSDKTKRALQAFEATRAAGGRIEDAFAQLEQDLGLEPGSSDDLGDTAPDFPGVVGAMVEEFLWERAANREPELNANSLHQFAGFAAHIGAFEDVSHSDLLLFTGCWLIERGKLDTPNDARQTLIALEEFCRWAEREHSVALWTLFEDSFLDLTESLPRLVRANQLLEQHAANSRVLLYQLDPDLRAQRVDMNEAGLEIDSALHEHLREGDLVRAIRNKDSLTIVGCYPGLVRSILQPQDLND